MASSPTARNAGSSDAVTFGSHIGSERIQRHLKSTGKFEDGAPSGFAFATFNTRNLLIPHAGAFAKGCLRPAPFFSEGS